MSRIRLTERLAANSKKAESQADGLFPGDVGNMERSKNYRKIDQYQTFEQQVNHELPDMRHEWQDNPRDEVGFGIPKSAKKIVVTAALNATKLAYLFLGEKASEKMIEAQARDFMRLGSARLESSLKRFAETENLYSMDHTEIIPLDEAPTPAEQMKSLQEKGNVVAEDEDMETTEDEEDEVNDEDNLEDDTVESCDQNDVEADEDEEVIDNDEIAPESVEADEDEDEDETVEQDNKPQTENDFDFGVESSDDEDDEDIPDDLNGIFDDGNEDDSEEETYAKVAKKASKKSGIKKLGGQPKIASSVKADELADLWKFVPGDIL